MRKALPKYHALTNIYPGIANRLITKARVAEAFDLAGDPTSFPTSLETDALWDTGATHSVITPKVVTALNLKATGTTFAQHGGGRTQQDTYMVNLMLPNGVAFAGVIMAEMDKVVDDFGIIIGMDIISNGDFSITNFGGKTCFSFRIPSKQTVDFVKEFRSQMKGAIGPNELCPCGSGNKFKKCHGGRS